MAGCGIVRPRALGASAATRVWAAGLVVLLFLAPVGAAELTLSDPGSTVYYRYALVAGDRVQVEKDVEVTGDLHSNGDVDLEKNSSVDGDVTAVGSVDLQGAVSGAVSEGEAPLELPELLGEAALRALADRVFEKDTTFTDATIDDVVFVAGTARFRGDLGGAGTVIATRDVRLDTTGGGGFAPLGGGTRLSLIAGNDIRLGKDRPFRGVLRAGRDIELETDVELEGVAVADRTIHLKQGARVTFLDVDQEAPKIELLSPPDGVVVATAVPEIRVAYGDDLSGVRPDGFEILLDGVDVTAEADLGPDELTFTPAPLADGLHTLEVAVTDHSDNEARESFRFTTDTEPPAVAVTSPADPVLYNAVPAIVVEYSDATSGVVLDSVAVVVDGVPLDGCTIEASTATCPAPELAEGEHTVTAEALDLAGNAATASFGFELVFDTEPPALAVTAPDAPVLFNDPTPEVAVEYADAVSGVDLSTLVVSVDGAALGGCSVTASAATCEPPELAGGTHTVSAAVHDAAGNGATASRSFELIFDTEPPTIDLAAPDHVTLERGGRAVAEVEDDVAVAEVVFRLDGVELARATEPPFEADVAAPAGAEVGDVLVLTAEASDPAGNVATAAHEIRVVAAGVVVGQVLSDETGHPLAGVRVRLLGEDEREATTDAAGRYSLPASGLQAVLRMDSPDGSTVPVERRLEVVPEVGSVAVDARLRPFASPVTIGPGGGTAAAAEGITLAVPAGALAAATPVRLTRLGAQGLPGLLPLGWSPLVAFDVAFDVEPPGGFSTPAEATVDGLPSETLYLARYDRSVHRWVMVEPHVVAGGGAATVALDGTGSYALLALDADADLELPAAGAELPGVAAEPLPPGAVCEGEVVPPVLPPGGGTARGILSLISPLPLPSGTVVLTEVTETFTLASGTEGSEEVRSEDVIFYRRPAPPEAALGAEIPVVPVRTFGTGELMEARVHTEILSGRVTTRGRLGGEIPVTVTSGGAALSVAGGSLAENTAVSVEVAELSPFVPVAKGLVPVAEVVVDLSGKWLEAPAELSVDGGTASPEDSLLVARVERIDGVPRLVVVASAELAGDRVVTKSHPDLPGIRVGGRYVVYRSSGPFGLVRGVTRTDSGPVRALVETDRWPFVALSGRSGSDGAYVVAAPPGPATLTARVPSTAVSGSAGVEVLAGETVVADLLLAGTVTQATVSPADGAVDVPVSAQIEIETAVPLDRASVTADAVALFTGPAGGGQTVPVRLVLSASGLTLSVIPESRLAHATTYTFAASGLADTRGGLVAVPTVSFTTEAEPQRLEVDPDQIDVTFPDADGLVHIQAPPGTLPPGTTILILNTGNGVAISVTVGNDGSLDAEIPATIDDVLEITLADPQGNVLTFERSRFVAQDGSGRTAIGPGGGVVEGPGGTEIRIPERALDEGAVFAVAPLGREAFPELPDVPGGSFGGGLLVTAPPDLQMKREGDLVFPKPPDAPDGAWYEVYRRLSGPDGQVGWEVIDHAFVEGEGADAKVVTASYPKIGMRDSVVSWQAAADYSVLGFGLGSQTSYCLMYAWDAASPGFATQGLITGNVRRAVLEPGSADPVYEPIPGMAVQTHKGVVTMARSQPDGTYALLDPLYFGGPIEVITSGPAGTLTATAYEADPDMTRDLKLPIQYRNTAIANFIFPPEEKPETVAAFETRVMKLDAAGKRENAGGIVVAGTPLIIGFRFTSEGSLPTIQSATIGGETISVQKDVADDPLRVDFVLNRTFTPSVAGRYTIHAAALSPFGGSPITVEHTFLAVAPGGSNRQTIPGPPDVISELVTPSDGSFGVPIDVLPSAAFTEPVNHLPGNIRLLDEEDRPVQIQLSGLGVDAAGAPVVIEDLEAAGAEAAVTSVTVRPLETLRFGTEYRLVLDEGIADLDETPEGDPDPQPLVDAPRIFTFQTFGPELMGQTDFFPGRDVVALGERSYVATEDGAAHGWIVAYDIANPATPVEVGRTALTGRALSVDGMSFDQATGGPLVVAVAAPNPVTRGPSNLYLLDASTDALERVGVVSLTQAMEEGTGLRVVVKGRYAYVITFRGTFGGTVVDIVDLVRARDLYEQALREGRSIGAAIVTAGVGFGREALIGSIPVRPSGSSVAGHLLGIAAGDLLYRGVSQTMVVTTGTTPPVAVVDPLTAQAVFADSVLESDLGALSSGRAVALGTLGGRKAAVIVGIGRGLDATGAMADGPVLVVLDLSTPEQPVLMSSLLLEGSPLDVALYGRLALVGTRDRTLLVSLEDPQRPTLSGEIAGLGGRLSVTEEGIVAAASSAQDVGGLRLAPLGATPVLRQEAPAFIALHCDEGEIEAIQDMHLQAVVVPRSLPVESASLQLLAGGQALGPAIPLEMTDGEASHVIPEGSRFPVGKVVTGVVSVVSRGHRLDGAPRPLDLARVELRVDANNDTWVGPADERAACDLDDPWAFWTPDPEVDPESTDVLTDRGTIQVRLAAEWPKSVPIVLAAEGVEFHLQGKPEREEGETQKDYLSDAAEAEFQRLVPTLSPDADGIALDALNGPENEFLFWSEDPYSCGKDCQEPRTLELKYREPRDGVWRTLDLAAVEIRDVEKWMSVYSSRSLMFPREPRAHFEMDRDWAELPGPAQADKITLLVHGFNVDTERSRGEIFPRLFKRLYWTEHPVLSEQCDEKNHCSHTIGIEWPGDEAAEIPIPIPAIGSIGISPKISYVYDEFNALQTGVPLADFLTSDLEGREIKVFAHSLGNVVVNSALSLLPVQDPPIVRKYVMWDAAIPAEVFSSDYQYSSLEQQVLINPSTDWGYPDDRYWKLEWDLFINPNPQRKEIWDSELEEVNGALEPLPVYFERWRQLGRPLRGPWTGRFEENLERTEIINVYNSGDHVLEIGGSSLQFSTVPLRLWQLSQTRMKPTVGPLGLLRTKPLQLAPVRPIHYRFGIRFWATLRDTEWEQEERLWSVASDNEHLTSFGAAGRAELTRGWAEMAYWFSSLSGAAGAQEVKVLPVNIALDEEGKSLSSTASHSYLVDKEFVDVWTGFEKINEELNDESH